MDSFSQEQKQYLQGFLAGVEQRGGKPYAGETPDGEITNDEEEAERDLADDVYGTPVDDLNKQERIKLEEDPMSIWDRMVENAKEGKFPEGDDVFRYKSRGLFYVAPAQEAFMMRCRIPACMLNTRQLRGIREIGDRWGGGYADITTRGNLQVREIGASDGIKCLRKLYEIGLTSKGAGADNVRNVTASPTSGYDPDEVYDVRQIALGMHQYILSSGDLFGLPRKFNIAFDNGGRLSVAADTNDIGFIATEVGEEADIEPGPYFRIRLGGASGHRYMAKDANVVVKPDQCVAVGAAMLRVFLRNGDRTNRRNARLAKLLDDWGIPKFLEKVEEEMTFDFMEVPQEHCKPRVDMEKHGHLGVHDQAEDGLNYIGVGVPVGRLTTDQMETVAHIMEEYGQDDVRFTIFQSLMIPGIADEDVETVKEMIEDCGLTHNESNVKGGVVACTGNVGCKFAMTDTKGQALELPQYLNEKIDLDHPINIHLTGCPNSCAQHYCGDIGLLGVTAKDDDGESVEAYDIALGGGMDEEHGLGRDVVSSVPFDEVPPLLEDMLETYLDERASDDETFVEFTRRHEVDELKSMFDLAA